MGNILIVEDDPNIRKLVRVNLTKRGYTVSEAEDSHQAMALFQAESVDLVVLDLMLPGLSGVDICKWIRAALRCAHHCFERPFGGRPESGCARCGRR